VGLLVLAAEPQEKRAVSVVERGQAAGLQEGQEL
jgi:hypothetical protein